MGRNTGRVTDDRSRHDELREALEAATPSLGEVREALGGPMPSVDAAAPEELIILRGRRRRGVRLRRVDVWILIGTLALVALTAVLVFEAV